jgi:hypothetical protein
MLLSAARVNFEVVFQAGNKTDGRTVHIFPFVRFAQTHTVTLNPEFVTLPSRVFRPGAVNETHQMKHRKRKAKARPSRTAAVDAFNAKHNPHGLGPSLPAGHTKVYASGTGFNTANKPKMSAGLHGVAKEMGLEPRDILLRYEMFGPQR